MAGKQKTTYRCTACGFSTGKWAGCCLSCNEWGTLEEQTPQASNPSDHATSAAPAHLFTLNQVPDSMQGARLVSGISEWDRVLGGGLVPGAFIILTGDPGIGKSTLLLQVAESLTTHGTVMYVSSEESLSQIKQRAQRIHTASSSVLFSDIANLDTIVATAQKHKPNVIILDSIQNCYLGENDRALPGSVAHIKEAGFRLMKLAKENNIAVIITGHITKEGSMAGPKVLEHIVDGVFYLQGEDRWHLRMLRAVKNRFGTINELGFFEMKEKGMHPLANINKHLLSQSTHAPGAVLTCSLEGSRPLLLELQALCVQTKFAMPQRVITGVDPKRVMLIAAILEKYLHTAFSSFDIFFKVSGGCTIRESASDLAIALALLSSFFQHPLPEKSFALGEINLTGQIKPVNQIELRTKEAEKFGLQKALLSREQNHSTSLESLSFTNIYELMALFPEQK